MSALWTSRTIGAAPDSDAEILRRAQMPRVLHAGRHEFRVHRALGQWPGFLSGTASSAAETAPGRERLRAAARMHRRIWGTCSPKRPGINQDPVHAGPFPNS